MKPRFSILTLLGLTAYAAVNVAAFSYPRSGWSAGVMYAWLAIVLGIGLKCIALSSTQGIFVRGMLIGTIAYSVAFMSQALQTVGWYRNGEIPFTPHGLAIVLVGGPSVPT